MNEKKNISNKKEKTSDEIGSIIYQVIQMGLSHPDLSVESLIKKLKLSKSDLVEQYESEAMIALMFQAILVVESQYDYPSAGNILDGMTKEFVKHLKEMEATEENVKYFLMLFHTRIKEYYEAERNKTGDGPFYWAGKKFFENLTGKNQNHINDSDRYANIMTKFNFLICANYLTAVLVGLKPMLEEFTIKK